VAHAEKIGHLGWLDVTLRVLLYAALVIIALFFTTPVVLMVMTSVRPLSDLGTGSIISWPTSLSFEAWPRAWQEACIGTECSGIGKYFLNSLLAVTPAVILSTALGAINGYALTKVRFKGADALFTLVWIGCFIPYQSVLIPTAQVLGNIHLSGSLTGLALVYTIFGIPFTTLFFRNYYINIPDELIKSATIDGAGFFRTFYHIVLPLSTPIIVVSVIFQFTNIWNEFLFAVSFVTGSSQTVTVALNNLVNTTFGVKEYNVDMAAALMVSAPSLVVYVLAGRYFLSGLSSGAVKG
jgi:glucose/mannose transport system permease protein